MKKSWITMIPVYALVFLGLLFCALAGDRAVTVMSENAPIENRRCFIVDAGHGGVDGGAVSCTGKYESHINLEIAVRLNDLLHLLGYETKMIRTTDISIYTAGESIAAKKASDLKERVRIVNETPGAILVSIHQNHFSDSRYSGAQVFYPQTPGSEALARQLQSGLVTNLNPGSKRMIKKGEGIYLLDHITCPGVLIECGFLSNPMEAEKLAAKNYRQKLCSVIATELSRYLSNT